SGLDHKLVEFTALVAARELDCKHEWAAHVAHGQKAGIPMETIRAVYQKKGTESFSSEDAQIVSFVRECSDPTGSRKRLIRLYTDAWESAAWSSSRPP